MKKLFHYAILLFVLLGLTAVVFLLSGWAFPQQAKMPSNQQPLRGIVPTNTPGGNVKSGEAEMYMSACNGTFGDGNDEALCHSNIHYEYEKVFYTGIIGIEDVIACYVWLPEEYVDPQGTPHPNPIPVAGENPYPGYKAGGWYLNTDGDPFGGTDSWEDCFLRVEPEDFTVLSLSTKKYEEDQNGDYVRLKRYELKDGEYSEEENGYYLKDMDGVYYEDLGNRFILKDSEIFDNGNGRYIAYGNGKYAEIDDTSYRINGEFKQDLKSFVQNGQPHTAVYYLYEKEVTFRVENGSWEDGSKEEKKVALNYTTANNRFNRIPDIQRLSEKQIPKAGTNPDQGYKAGRWKKIVSVSGNPVTEDEAPDTSTAIEETEVTYVYSYEKIKDSCTVTFRVENGSWGDGTKEDKQVTLTAGEGGVFNLSAEQIPAAGSKPDQGYKAGCWPVVPDIGTTIEDDVIYTYRYAPAASEDSKVYTVTFCVENGFWGNGTSNDRNVMLTGPDTGVLMDYDQIPEAGCNPAQGYKSADQFKDAGSWKKIDSKGVIFDDADPYQLGNVTESVTYIYTYAPKNETETVTFKVVNGSWDEGGNGEKQITLTAGEGGKFKLSADQIPAVGKSPSEGFVDSGYWDIVPDTVSEIPGNTTYTFTYRQNVFDRICIFRVFGGSWNDGSTNDRMALAVFDNDTHRINFLFPEQIPKVGSLPARNHIKEYDENNWDVIPRGFYDAELGKLYQSSSESEWTRIKNEYFVGYDGKLFTYTYQKKKKTDYTVTCQVENGSWDNETDDPVTVRLSRYENGDPPVLKSNLIPEAGSRPAEHFKAGSWTKDSIGKTTAEAPNTDTFVTADTTYTYTYAEQDKISFNVSFKVENGKWNDRTSGEKNVTLWRYADEDLALTLSSEDIPAAGNEPEEGCEEGGWTKLAGGVETAEAPTVETVISGDTVYTYSYKTIPTHTHTWDKGTVTKYPSCTVAGTKKYTCLTCGAVRKKAIPPTGHSFRNNAKYCLNGCGTPNPYYKKTDISSWTVEGIEDLVYTGEPLEQSNISVTKDGKYAEFTTEYKDNINAGQAVLIITGSGEDYEGEIVTGFTIKKAKQKITLSVSSLQLAVGQKQTVAAEGAKGKVTFWSADPNIAHSGRKTGVVQGRSPGKVMITVTAAETDNYRKAKKKFSVKVVPKTPAITSLVSKKNGLKAVWEEVSYADKYQIQYCRNKEFSGNVKKRTTLNTYKTVGGLKKGRTYYVRVRAFKITDGKKYYSSWSKVKKVKI